MNEWTFETLKSLDFLISVTGSDRVCQAYDFVFDLTLSPIFPTESLSVLNFKITPT